MPKLSPRKLARAARKSEAAMLTPLPAARPRSVDDAVNSRPTSGGPCPSNNPRREFWSAARSEIPDKEILSRAQDSVSGEGATVGGGEGGKVGGGVGKPLMVGLGLGAEG
jgi:hypothetical protein